MLGLQLTMLVKAVNQIWIFDGSMIQSYLMMNSPSGDRVILQLPFWIPFLKAMWS